MKQPLITRRQFLKAGAFGVGALAVSATTLISVVAPAPKEAQAAAEQPNKLAIPQPTFNAIASSTLFGPPTDLSAGWDGTLWATDASGAPHLYDPIANQWNLHGEGIDAAAYDSQKDTLYLFRGSQYVTVNHATNQTRAPIDIAATWSTLPDSFKLGVSGAAYYGTTLYLFKGGWYVPADGSTPPQKLTAISGWPQTANWQEGLFDALVTGDPEFGQIYLFHGSEYIDVSLYYKIVIGPNPIVGNWTNYILPAWQTAGFDAGVMFSAVNGIFYKSAAASVNAAAPGYIAATHANWPMTWNPILNHAPSGRMGNLWVSAKAVDFRVLRHDGEEWSLIPGNGPCTSVGQDNSVYLVGNNQGLFRWNGAAFEPQGHLTWTQVSVGDDGHVWVRDENNNVQYYNGNNTFTPVNLGAGVPNPTHIAANADGTLWHCNSASANAQRFISEALAPSAAIPVKQGLVTGVQKVASTGFGAAYCLATQTGQSQPQLYRYDSPYLFKTAGDSPIMGNGGDGFLADVTGGTFAQGLGNLYGTQFVNLVSGDSLTVRFIALDAHTGQEVASHQPPAGNVQYTDLVFDPVNELIYVGTAPWGSLSDPTSQTSSGQIIALDARTLDVKWIFATVGGIDGAPALNGTQLCFGDRINTLYMIDTRTALAAARHNQAITTKWMWTVPTLEATQHRVSTPIIANGKVHAVAWDLGTGNTVDCIHHLASCDAATGLNGITSDGDTIPNTSDKPLNYQFIVSAPALGKTRASDRNEVDAIFVNDGFSVIAHSLDTTRPVMTPQFLLPDGQITTGFAYDDGSRIGPAGLPSGGLDSGEIRLWFGDTLGNLWSLDYQLFPTDNTPINIAQNTQIVTTPILYKDPQGGLTVLFGVLDGGNTLPPGLYGVDPETGNSASVPTGVTGITMLSAGVTNGLVYAGGVYQPNDPPGSPKQVFGIRVDQLPQALRDFIIESQMMQDPDETAPGGDPTDPVNPIPPSRARYQTHLSIVHNDPNQPGVAAPIPHEPVKIWADAPTTIAVGGVSYPIGPEQHASVKTGADGSLVILSGYVDPNGTDVPDVYAPVLRVWAGFMNTYERIVINPDHEFHQRISTAHANAIDDNPDKVNLITTQSYAGLNGAKPIPLFTQAEQTAGQPKNCASAIAQMKSGVDFGGSGNSPKTLFNRLLQHAGGGKTAKRNIRRDQVALNAAVQSPQKYMAYADLTSAGYFPANIPAPRPTSVTKPAGLLFVKPKGQPSTSATFTATDHMTAQAAIDALPAPTVNPPWEQTSRSAQGVFVVRRADNIFTDFWNWLKRKFEELAIEITDIVISIADEVMVGIRMLVKGLETVFKAIVKVIDDIASAIGSFFKMLSKFIEDVVAAFSVLFHFGEIIWTHTWLADQFQSRVDDLKNAITGSITASLNTFFANGEAAVQAAFNKLRGDLNGNTKISSLKGAGATPHTMFTFGSRGGTPSSHAVQCNYGNQKFKSGAPLATETSSVAGLIMPREDSTDPVSSFFTAFVNSLSSDPTLIAAFSQLKTDGSKLFHPHSAGQFFTTFLATLLDILQALIISALAVSKAFLDGLLTIIDGAIEVMMSILMTEIEIPFLTWLYEKLFKGKFTFLNLATLVAAIPVTLICRVVEGQYPSKLFPPVSTLQANRVAKAPAIIIRYLGVFNGMLAFAYGTANCVGDIEGDEAAPLVGKISLGIGLMMEAFSLPLIANDPSDVSADDWTAYGFGVAATLLGIGGISYTGEDGNATSPIDGVVQSVMTAILNIMLLTATIGAFVNDGKTDAGTDIGFAAGLVATLPGLINPVKLAPEPAPLIVGAVDFIGGCIVGALQIAVAVFTTEPAPTQQRWYLPIVAVESDPTTSRP